MDTAIDSSFLNYQPVSRIGGIDSNMINYTKTTKDPVQNIINNSELTNCDKIKLIDDLLVSKYNIIKGPMSKMLATISVGDPLLIGREKSKNRRKKFKKKKK